MEAAIAAYLLNLARPWLFRLAIGGVVAIAAGGGFLTLKIHYTNVGYRQAIDKIAAEDRETIDVANKARDRVRACYAAGGVWDVSEGQCHGQ